MTILKERDGITTSSRRTAAFICIGMSNVFGILAIIFKSDWQTVAVCIGIPIVAMLILFFFTTWSDVAAIIKASKNEAT